jgi:hypothetical protein
MGAARADTWVCPYSSEELPIFVVIYEDGADELVVAALYPARRGRYEDQI